MISTWGWLAVIIGIFVLWRMIMFVGIENLPSEAFQEKRKQHPGPLIDVREPHEFRSAHIPAAKNIPLGQIQKVGTRWDKDQPIYVYCRSGSRSAMAARQLRKLGFQRVYNLRGGIRSWPYSLKS